MHARRSRSEQGFTLVEMAVALGILGLLLAATYSGFLSAQQRANNLNNRADLQGEARSAIDAFVRDLRQAYTGDFLTPVVSAISTTSITFLSPDRADPYHLRQIAYSVSNGVLQRGVTLSTNTDGPPWTFPAAATPRPVAHGLQSGTVFTGLDGDQAATTDPAEIRSVSVTLRVDDDPRRGPGMQTYSTTVALRSHP